METHIPPRLVRAEQVLAARTRRACVVLERSQDPHNVHAVLRTAEALGVQDVHLVGLRGEAAAIAPGLTQRAHQWLTVHRHPTIDDALGAVRSEGREIWAAHVAADAVPLTGLTIGSKPVAILFGNETDGLSETALQEADRTFRIDLVGFTGSINLSVAAAITLWELRREAVGTDAAGDLSADERSGLRGRWYGCLLGRRARGSEETEHWLARADEVRDLAASSPRVLPADRTR